jgi:uncharacterized HhH-GPD family protein
MGNDRCTNLEDAMTLSLPVDASANELLTRSPLALFIALVLDQQVPLEKAFGSPQVLVQRLGHEPTAEELADYDPEALAAVFSERPALHRFPRAMAARVQELCKVIADRYDGDAARIWRDATTGKELAARLSELPGFGTYKAQIMIALLGKQLGVRPDGWREAAGRFGEEGSRCSVADIVDDASLAEVRAFKKQSRPPPRRQPADRTRPRTLAVRICPSRGLLQNCFVVVWVCLQGCDLVFPG